MRLLTHPIALLYQHRALIGRSVAAELKYKIAGTSLGVFWLLLTPVLLLIVYSVATRISCGAARSVS